MVFVTGIRQNTSHMFAGVDRFVRHFADLGVGQGGYNEDHEFYG